MGSQGSAWEGQLTGFSGSGPTERKGVGNS